MKNWVYLLLGVATALLLTACGKSSGGSSSNRSANVGVCQAGYVNSQYGCLQQSGCPSGYGLYNGQCVVATNQHNNCQAGYVYSSQYGCLQQGNCQQGYGLYGNQCVYADGAYNQQYNNGYNYDHGYNYNQGYWGTNPYMPNPYYNGGGSYYRQCYWYFGQMMCQ